MKSATSYMFQALVCMMVFCIMLPATWMSAFAITPPNLVQDLNRCPAAISNVARGWAIKGKYITFLSFPEYGSELGVIEGNKVSLLKDISPGIESSYIEPFNIWVINNLLIFSLYPDHFKYNNNKPHFQIWRSDGTTSGTFPIIDTVDSAEKSATIFPSFVAAPLDQDRILLSISGSSSSPYDGDGLYISDGSSSGTKRIDLSSSPFRLARPKAFLGGGGYFAADSTVGNELFRYSNDGKIDLIKDLVPGPGSGYGSNTGGDSTSNTQMFYMATTPEFGSEVYVTDGTPEGTRQLRDFSPGPASTRYHKILKRTNTKVFFMIQDSTDVISLWVTDGTPANTQLLFSPQPLAGQKYFSVWSPLGRGVVARLFNAATGFEPWYVESPSFVPRLLKDFIPGPEITTDGGITTYAHPRDPSKGIFIASTPESGAELFVSDGSSSGTKILSDLNPGAANSGISGISTDNSGSIFFLNQSSQGTFLYQSDGSDTGTKALTNFQFGPNRGSNPFGAERVTETTVIFLAGTCGSFRSAMLYDELSGLVSQLTADTVLALNLVGKIGSRVLINVWNRQFGYELWISDGTERGTVLLKDIRSGGLDSRPSHGVSILGKVFFWADDGVHGKELFQSDGTAAGTTLVKDILPGSAGSFTETPLTVLGTKVLFFAVDADGHKGLWSSDGSADGTMKVKDFEDIRTDPQNPLVAIGDAVYFVGYEADSGYELWRSDGTAAGTSLFIDIAPGPYSSIPQDLTAAGNKLYFNTQRGDGVWVSEGTSESTVALALPSSSSQASWFTPVKGGVVFSLTLPEYGSEIWFSDGTPEGTRIVRDIRIGNGSSGPSLFKTFQGRVYFSALTEDDGRELWTTDGTAEGTLQVDSIAPGSKSSNPNPFFATDSTLFISADDTLRGQEPYVIMSQSDLCPSDSQKVLPGACGCGKVDTDQDGDGTADCLDLCPQDPLKTAPGQCGCSTREVLQPPDAAPACPNQCGNGQNCACLSTSFDPKRGGKILCPSDQKDECPLDSTKYTPGVCGCGVPDADVNLDGRVDCLVDQIDQCPNDPVKRDSGACGCGTPDSDENKNGVADCKVKADLLRQFVRATKSVNKLKITTPRELNKKIVKKLKAQLKQISQDVSSALRDLVNLRKTVALLKQKKVGKLLKDIRAELKALRKVQSKDTQAQLLKSLKAMKKTISVIPERNF